MKTLIINADDFGYSKGTNYAIIDTFKKGIVTSTTMMMNMNGTEHAIELAKEHPDLGVGIHLVLTCGKPLSHSHEVKTLIDEDGLFYRRPTKVLLEKVNLNEVEREWKKQIDLFYSYGLIPTHLDSHHHVHAEPILHNVITKISKEYNLPVRRFPNMKEVRPFSDIFRSDFYGVDISHSLLNEMVAQTLEGETTEIMVHPAYIDADLLNGTSYCMERVKETELLMTWNIPEGVKIYAK